MIGHGTMTKLLKVLQHKTGIKKRVNPHNFRHSRASHLAKHLTEAQMCQHFGWAMGSEMTRTYVHLSGRDVDSALLGLHGIVDEDAEIQKSKLAPRVCPRCKTSNECTAKFCNTCGMVVDEAEVLKVLKRDEDRQRIDEIFNRIVQDDEKRSVFLSLIGQVVENETLNNSQ